MSGWVVTQDCCCAWNSFPDSSVSGTHNIVTLLKRLLSGLVERTVSLCKEVEIMKMDECSWVWKTSFP